MMIAKLGKERLNNLKKVVIVVPVLNVDKTRIVDFIHKSYKRSEFANQLNAYIQRPDIYNIDHWFQNEQEIHGLIYRKSQHLYKFNDDILIYLSMKYNLKPEITALNLEQLKNIENLC